MRRHLQYYRKLVHVYSTCNCNEFIEKKQFSFHNISSLRGDLFLRIIAKLPACTTIETLDYEAARYTPLKPIICESRTLGPHHKKTMTVLQKLIGVDTYGQFNCCKYALSLKKNSWKEPRAGDAHGSILQPLCKTVSSK